MNINRRKLSALAVAMLGVLLVWAPRTSTAAINGLSGTSFAFTAKADRISTPDGNSLLLWGYANGTGRAQYPGPTLIVNQGDTVTVTLTTASAMPLPTSIVFPGQDVTAVGGNTGLLTQEAPADGTTVVTYTFTASHAGTYMYHSGTRPELQVEMGLVGALIVRPIAGADHSYNHPGTRFDREYLFLLSEMDPRIHDTVELYGVAALNSPAYQDYLTDYVANYWFINGRAAPDTMSPSGTSILPTQPYGAMVMMYPGEVVLNRLVNAGRDLHPFHQHGNHVRILARDGRLLESTPGVGPDLSFETFTVKTVPGQTVDATFEWTGKGMGWDIYGTGPAFAHNCMDTDSDDYDDVTSEWCPDHGKEFPVQLPPDQDLAFGGFFSGSPFLGAVEPLPPGEGGLNPNGGFAYMWHSHVEREMTNWDIFPGGMMTMLVIEAPSLPMM